MSWLQIKHKPNVWRIFSVVGDKDSWVLRGKNEIYGFDSSQRRFAWVITDIDKNISWGNKTVVQSGGYVIASSFLGCRDDMAWLFALDPKTGNLVWQKHVHWDGYTANGSFGGLAATDQFVILIEEKYPASIILWIDSSTGNTVHKCEGIKVNDTGIIVGAYIYFFNRIGGGIYRIPVQPGTNQLEKVSDVSVKSMVASEENLYCAYTQKQDADWFHTVICWDADSLEERGWLLFPGTGKHTSSKLLTVSPDHPHWVIQIFNDKTCSLLDLDKKHIVWEHVFPRTISALWTPQGILVADFSRRCIIQLDEETGQISETNMPTEETLYRIGEYVLVSRHSSCRIYMWEETAPFIQDDFQKEEETETWTKTSIETLIVDDDQSPDP